MKDWQEKQLEKIAMILDEESRAAKIAWFVRLGFAIAIAVAVVVVLSERIW